MAGDVNKGVSGEVPDSEWSFGPLVVAGQPTFLRAARVELPEETPDPTVLPTITLLERAASRGIDPDELPLPSGQLLAGQYLLIRPLGYGGTGEVYLALDTRVDDREVAIKILHPDQAAVAAGALVRERRALVDLSHDDIIRVYNYGHHPEVGDFLVLQYVDGLTLEEVRARARLNPHEFGCARFHEFVLAYGVRILSALGHLHTGLPGKVYGDLKPDNVMHDGTATKIIDVGSVRAAGLPGLTTGGFRAPTVGPGGESTGQDDLYSLGETLRRLSGLGGSPQDLARLGDLGTSDSPDPPATEETTTPAPRGLGLVSLARVLHRATRSERHERFADALSNAHGRYLCDPAFEPLWAELDRRSAVVLVHPTAPPGPPDPALPPAPLVDFPYDTTRTALHPAMRGVPRRHPRIRMILPHAGGFLPYAAHRLALAGHLDPDITPEDLLTDLRRFYFDTALAGSPATLPSLLALRGPRTHPVRQRLPHAPRGVGHRLRQRARRVVGRLGSRPAPRGQPRQRRDAHSTARVGRSCHGWVISQACGSPSPRTWTNPWPAPS